MNFVSRARRNETGFAGAAIASGLAPDGGLFIPASLPRLPIRAFRQRRLARRHRIVLLRPISRVTHWRIISIRFAQSHSPSTLRCGDWPRKTTTCWNSFTEQPRHSSFGARFLAACMRRQRRDEEKIVDHRCGHIRRYRRGRGAAFYTLPHFRLSFCIPTAACRHAVRPVSSGCFGDNVRALRVSGSFDDCQRLAKLALADSQLQDQVPLSSANSISLGRLLPQMAYYARASLAHFRTRNALLNFVVPTGNLGNAVACIAKRTRWDCRSAASFFPPTPIRRCTISSPAATTRRGQTSPRWPTRWTSVRRAISSACAGFIGQRVAASISCRRRRQQAIRVTIRDRHTKHGEIFCPHTATAIRTLENLRQEGAQGDWAAVATAHAAKFEQVVEPLIGCSVDIPPVAGSTSAPAEFHRAHRG